MPSKSTAIRKDLVKGPKHARDLSSLASGQRHVAARETISYNSGTNGDLWTSRDRRIGGNAVSDKNRSENRNSTRGLPRIPERYEAATKRELPVERFISMWSIRSGTFPGASSVTDLPRNFHFTRIIRQGIRERGCRGLRRSARFPSGANTLKAYPFTPLNPVPTFENTLRNSHYQIRNPGAR